MAGKGDRNRADAKAFNNSQYWDSPQCYVCDRRMPKDLMAHGAGECWVCKECLSKAPEKLRGSK